MKFKKVTALALCVAMSATALVGCGSKAATTDSQTAAPAESAAADTADRPRKSSAAAWCRSVSRSAPAQWTESQASNRHSRF